MDSISIQVVMEILAMDGIQHYIRICFYVYHDKAHGLFTNNREYTHQIKKDKIEYRAVLIGSDIIGSTTHDKGVLPALSLLFPITRSQQEALRERKPPPRLAW